MDIKRDFYLNKLIERKNDGFVKFVTGIRRCGKSYLLNVLFKEHLRSQGVGDAQIIELALDDDANEELRDPRRLSAFIRDKVVSHDIPYYVLIDEIQMCEEVPSSVEGSRATLTFYDTLNGLVKIPNLDVYVTGSNSKMLSDEVPTHFRDRGEVLRMHPLSFSEYLPASGLSEYRAWGEYLVYGGMPEAVLKRNPQDKREYLSTLFKTLYLKDIVEHNGLRNDFVLGALVNVLMSTVGSLTNLSKIVSTLESTQGIKPSIHTVQEYIGYLKQAYIFKQAERYDVKGRRYLSYPSKYYAEDVGLRNAMLNYRQTERTHLMENIIFNELVSRGANVDVGVVDILSTKDGKRERSQHEIDFIVNLGMDKLYIQSAYEMATEAKADHELLPLRKTGDSFRKLVITGDDQPLYTDENGISFVGILPFLLDKSILSRLMA